MPVFFEASAKSSAILIFGKASLSTACKFKLGLEFVLSSPGPHSTLAEPSLDSVRVDFARR